MRIEVSFRDGTKKALRVSDYSVRHGPLVCYEEYRWHMGWRERPALIFAPGEWTQVKVLEPR